MTAVRLWIRAPAVTRQALPNILMRRVISAYLAVNPEEGRDAEEVRRSSRGGY